ncbi:hypothetical protein Cni_G25260 [Canna indica]|uniref:DUF679 domain membrane protein 7 n=1 Tax=Canna indica TaxID=4628 RepID=A0AAQ3KWQ0_9LILI|nr:hypothetical protein Cni_G25260 [Canna indica]
MASSDSAIQVTEDAAPDATTTAAITAGTTTTTQQLTIAPVVDKTLSIAANLAQLLPTGTVLVFQSLAPSFARHGVCYATNRYLTVAFMVASVASCTFFAVTDSLLGGDGKLYYGLATLNGFLVLNYDGPEEERNQVFAGVDLASYKLRVVDYVHVVFTVLMFLSVAFGDAMIQKCLFPDAAASATEVLVNLPLGVGVVSTLVFVVFPTTRRGIGYTNAIVAINN